MPPPQALAALSRTAAGSRLTLTGRLDADGVALVWREAMECAASPGLRLTVDASGVAYCDGAGLALLLELRRAAEAAGAAFDLGGLNERYMALYAQFSPTDAAPPAEVDKPSMVEETGRKAMALVADMAALVSFVGEFAWALAMAAADPRRIRLKDAARVAETAGANALPIIVLIGFLMGLIMAFQSAMPLRQFGAEIFVGNLLGLSLFRELGPLVTAIILAGRSGSAFAAEIGAMTLNEEIDALKTMGLDPVRFLVVSRVTAAMAVTPLLSLVFSLCGLAGGALVMMSLGYPLVTFVNQVKMSVHMGDVVGGLAKSAAFALLVCAIGCQRGLRTRGGASSVGEAATSAVVAGIILIALADGAFAVTFYAMKW
jgi:phospholipid/cholesterol/gamma-HCH transport system permease protein